MHNYSDKNAGQWFPGAGGGGVLVGRRIGCKACKTIFGGHGNIQISYLWCWLNEVYIYHN